MVILKASPETFHLVVRHKVHAFEHHPRQIEEGEVVLLSKNGSGVGYPPQVSHVARVRLIRRANPDELERLFPGVDAGQRWLYIVELYCVCRLQRPFSLDRVVRQPRISYAQAQAHAKFREGDHQQVSNHLMKHEPGAVSALLDADPEEHERAA